MGRFLTEEQENQIVSRYEDGGISYRELASIYGVGRGVIERLCHERISEEKRRKIHPRGKSKSNWEDLFHPDKAIYKVNISDTEVNAAMISGRHSMPNYVTDAIFDTFKQGELFDFRFQEKKFSEFIDRNFKFDENGIPDKFLNVYVTGCQTALGTVIKGCYKRKIPLCLKHYGEKSGKYISQDIFDFDYKNKNIGKIRSLPKINAVDSIYTYNCLLDDVINASQPYAVEILHRGLFDIDNCKLRELFLCKSLKDAYEIQNDKAQPYIENPKSADIIFEAFLQIIRPSDLNQRQWYKKTIQTTVIDPTAY